MKQQFLPPSAKKIAKELVKHKDVRVDDYYWLNDRENPEVLAYLEQENAYYESVTADTNDLKEQLFQEMKSRIKEDDSSVPYKYNGYWYATRYEIGKEYPIFTRRYGTEDAPEEIMIDCNEMAEGFEYFSLGGLSVSPNNDLAVFGIDTVSRRQYTLGIKNLRTGEIYMDTIENTTGGAVWANDNKTIFYTQKDPVTLRSNNIYRHVLGTPTEEDEVVFHEDDDTFTTFVYKTKSQKFIVIGSSSTMTTEFQILDADDPNGKFKVFSERVRGLEYSLSHYGVNFYILTNKDGATNFKLMTTSEGQTDAAHWVDFIPHREEVLLEDIEIFNDYYVLSERENGLNKIKIVRWDNTESYYLPFNNETYTAYVGINPDYNTEILRYGYNSLTTPSSVIDFNMATKERAIKKEQEVLGGAFHKDNYIS
ncbi:MAG TPA: hypothetical protein VLZ54_08570, partial [Arenibacter sp.]|nr:hypothetical protein [Arenibacter sp.]